jgi:hypothetical protein
MTVKTDDHRTRDLVPRIEKLVVPREGQPHEERALAVLTKLCGDNPPMGENAVAWCEVNDARGYARTLAKLVALRVGPDRFRWRRAVELEVGGKTATFVMLREQRKPRKAQRTQPATAVLVAAVRAYAVKHYTEDGWDYIVEVYTDDEIAAELGSITTARAAIRKFHERAKLHRDNERHALGGSR